MGDDWTAFWWHTAALTLLTGALTIALALPHLI